jgi:hypothetical protein
VALQHQSQVNRKVVEAWLRERAEHWPVPTLLHRARIVDGFLDYLAQQECIGSNPIADLRAEYGVKSSAAIFRALRAHDPDQELEALRQPRPFASVLGDLMRDHIERMRTVGFRYETQTRCLLRFDRFLQAHPELATEPVPVMLQHWSTAKQTANHVAE